MPRTHSTKLPFAPKTRLLVVVVAGLLFYRFFVYTGPVRDIRGLYSKTWPASTLSWANAAAAVDHEGFRNEIAGSRTASSKPVHTQRRA